jgi:predicted nuclease of predicted toxin-antitoxin system
MKLLLDQDVYEATARLLSRLGHAVLRAGDLGLSRAEDMELLKVARDRDCILVTRDRDFGYLVLVDELFCGVMYLRILPETVNAVHRQIERLFGDQEPEKLKRCFVVVEPGRYRIRKLRDR